MMTSKAFFFAVSTREDSAAVGSTVERPFELVSLVRGACEKGRRVGALRVPPAAACLRAAPEGRAGAGATSVRRGGAPCCVTFHGFLRCVGKGAGAQSRTAPQGQENAGSATWEWGNESS